MLRVWWVGFEFLHLQLPLLFHCGHAPLLSLPHNSWASCNGRVTHNGINWRMWEDGGSRLHCVSAPFLLGISSGVRSESQWFSAKWLSSTVSLDWAVGISSGTRLWMVLFLCTMTITLLWLVGVHRIHRLARPCAFGGLCRNLPFDVLLPCLLYTSDAADE